MDALKKKRTERDLDDLKFPYRVFCNALAFALVVGGFCFWLIAVIVALRLFGIDTQQRLPTRSAAVAFVALAIGGGAVCSWLCCRFTVHVLAITAAVLGHIPWRSIKERINNFDYPPQWLKCSIEPSASPNGGPAAPLGGSGASEGPPSVS